MPTVLTRFAFAVNDRWMDQDRRLLLRRLRFAAALDRASSGGIVHACAPWDEIDLLGSLADELTVWLPGFEDRCEILVGGIWQGRDFTASVGRLTGQRGVPLGAPGRSGLAELRYGRIDRWEGNQLAETWIIFDLSAPLIELGLWPAAPPLGPPILLAPAHAADRPDPDGTTSLTKVEAMIAGLMRYDGHDLARMGMRDHWLPDFSWYGPAAIGAFRGHEAYERGHQRPFLTAFPDRVGGNHVARLGEGAWVASGGWPSIRATHLGGGWLGLPATGKPVTMRVMDFWRVDGERLAENWVFIDIPDLLCQLGLDPFARMAEMLGGSHG